MSLRDDPQLRALVELARSWGVPPSVFAGRPLVTRFLYEDETGRLTSSEQELWTDDDRKLADELAEYEAGLCSGCRQPLEQTTDPGNEDAYWWSSAIRCHRCTALDQASGPYRDAPAPHALMIPIEYRAPSPRPDERGDDDREHRDADREQQDDDRRPVDPAPAH